MEFNTGTSYITQMQAEMGSMVSSNMQNSLRRSNISQIKTAAKQITDCARMIKSKKNEHRRSQVLIRYFPIKLAVLVLK